MSHIVQTATKVALKNKDRLVEGFVLSKLVAVPEGAGYKVQIPGCNQEDVTSRLRADKEAVLHLRWNDAKQQYDVFGESYRIQTQYNDTVNKVVMGYQMASAKAALQKAGFTQVSRMVTATPGAAVFVGRNYT